MTKSAGQPPYYSTSEEMQKAIDDYIENQESVTVIAVDGTLQEKKVLTITGLCLALGFESRQSFYDYEKRSEFSYIIKRARLMVENGIEKDLMINPAGQAGKIFILKNMGWSDRQDVNHTSSDGSMSPGKGMGSFYEADNADDESSS